MTSKLNDKYYESLRKSISLNINSAHELFQTAADCMTGDENSDERMACAVMGVGYALLGIEEQLKRIADILDVRLGT